MRSRLWDEDATIVVSKAVFRAFPFGIWDMGDQVEVTWGITRQVRAGRCARRRSNRHDRFPSALPADAVLTDARDSRRMVDATPPYADASGPGVSNGPVGFFLSWNALENPIRDFAIPTAVPGRPDERPDERQPVTENQ